MVKIKYSCDGFRPVIVYGGQCFDAAMHYASIAARRKYGLDAHVAEIHEFVSHALPNHSSYAALIGRYNKQAHCCTTSQVIVLDIAKEEEEISK